MAGTEKADAPESAEDYTPYRAPSGSAQGARHWVEVRARLVGGEREAVEMRSHNLGLTIQLPPEEWDALVLAVKAGEFDDL